MRTPGKKEQRNETQYLAQIYSRNLQCCQGQKNCNVNCDDSNNIEL